MRHPVLMLLLATLAFSASGVEIPPSPTQWVTDRAGIIDDSTEASLNAQLQAFEERSGAQFIVYTLPSLEGDPIEDWTIRAVDRWKVGQAKYDNGLVLFVFPEDRLARIEVGYGLEGTITDALSSRILREVGQQYFRNGDYGTGITVAANQLMEQIELTEAPVPATGRGSRGGSSSSFGCLDLIVPFIFFLVLLSIVSRLSRRGGCGGTSGCLLPILFMPHGGGRTFGGGGFGGGGFGGFSGGGGGFGGGGATGSW